MTNFNLNNQEPVISEDRPNNKRWIWWVGGCVAILCLMVCAGIGILLFGSTRPDLLDASYTMPTTVKQGDEFDFVISMKNPTSEPIPVRHIVLDETVGPSILDGTTVISTEPEMEIDETYAPDKVAYSYFQSIPPGETHIVVFHLHAETPGTYGGPVSAYSALNPLSPFAFYFDPVTITITP